MKIKSVLLIAVFMAAVLCQAAHAANVKVTAANVTGTVDIQAGSSWKALKNGDVVPIGMKVRTGAGASCMLKWGGGHVMKLSALTTAQVTEAALEASGAEKSGVTVDRGRILAHARKMGAKDSSFKITTPTAVAGVRGTDVVTDVNDDGSSSFGVTGGNVEVEGEDGETVMLDENMYVEIDSGGDVSEPEPIPEQIMEEIKDDVQEVREESTADIEQPGGETSGGESSQGEGTEEDSSSDADAAAMDSATESIDNILDQEVTSDIVDEATAEAEYITGEVEIEFVFEP